MSFAKKPICDDLEHATSWQINVWRMNLKSGELYGQWMLNTDLLNCIVVQLVKSKESLFKTVIYTCPKSKMSKEKVYFWSLWVLENADNFKASLGIAYFKT